DSANQYTDQQVANSQAMGVQAARAHADAGDVATLAASNGYTATQVATVRSEARAGDAATLASANQDPDTTATQTLRSAHAYTDSALAAFSDDFTRFHDGVEQRLRNQDRRIDRMGAMTSAMTNMAMNAAGGQSARGRIAVGAGFQGGEQALSIGYGVRLGTRGSFSLGGAFGGGEKSAGVGFGVDL
ncbi:MAG: YadA-like family protein, partial [Stenotrophomonas sp.]